MITMLVHFSCFDPPRLKFQIRGRFSNPSLPSGGRSRTGIHKGGEQGVGHESPIMPTCVPEQQLPISQTCTSWKKES
jgi:hypothetical protein